MTYLQQTAPPEWYPDPEKPGYLRRWDGTGWVGTPRKIPTGSQLMFGEGYAKAYWFNANRILHITRWSVLTSVLAFFGVIFASSALSPVHGYTSAALLLVLIALVGAAGGVVAVITGIIGVSRAKMLGGLGGGIAMLVTSSLFALISILTLGITLLIAGSFG